MNVWVRVLCEGVTTGTILCSLLFFFKNNFDNNNNNSGKRCKGLSSPVSIHGPNPKP